jgi:hypothetical protein
VPPAQGVDLTTRILPAPFPPRSQDSTAQRQRRPTSAPVRPPGSRERRSLARRRLSATWLRLRAPLALPLPLCPKSPSFLSHPCSGLLLSGDGQHAAAALLPRHLHAAAATG